MPRPKNVPEFQAGFYDLAEDLRARGIDPGEPVHNEEHTGTFTFQTTTTGVMWWYPGSGALFLADPRFL